MARILRASLVCATLLSAYQAVPEAVALIHVATELTSPSAPTFLIEEQVLDPTNSAKPKIGLLPLRNRTWSA